MTQHVNHRPSDRIAELESENLQLRTELAKLQDPVAVHRNLLAGTIAKPAFRDMLHAYGKLEGIYEIANQLAGYVDLSTPDREANFMLDIANRISKWWE